MYSTDIIYSLLALLLFQVIATESDIPPPSSTKCKSASKSRPNWFAVVIFLVGWSNALTNGVLPSLQSYSCLPYGNLAYTLSVRLSVAVNPLACFAALFVQIKSTVALAVLTALGTVLAGYHVALAALSPTPPLVDTDIGPALAVSNIQA